MSQLEENESDIITAEEEGEKSQITEEDILKRHRAEKKELQANIQKIKKGINNCKKKKKEAVAEISKLEQNLKEKQERELKEFKESLSSLNDAEAQLENLSVNDGVVIGEANAEGIIGNEQQPKVQKVSRAAKRRAKKEEVARTREAELQKEREFQFKNSPRAIELRKMSKILEERSLSITDIPADGNCLYEALSHQLNGEKTMQNLRNITSDYMLEFQADFMPFLVDPDTGDMLSEDGYKTYCDNIANTTTWGGQPELRALSEALKRKIQVVQAEGADILFGEQFGGKALLLAYYRHMLSLGEHYNSLGPKLS